MVEDFCCCKSLLKGDVGSVVKSVGIQIRRPWVRSPGGVGATIHAVGKPQRQGFSTLPNRQEYTAAVVEDFFWGEAFADGERWLSG